MSIRITINFDRKYQSLIKSIIKNIKNKSNLKLHSIFILKEDSALIFDFYGDFNRKTYYTLCLLAKMLTFKYSEKKYNPLLKRDVPYYNVEQENFFILTEHEYITQYDIYSQKYIHSELSDKTVKETEENISLSEKDFFYSFSFDFSPNQINYITFLNKRYKSKFSLVSSLSYFFKSADYKKNLNAANNLFNEII